MLLFIGCSEDTERITEYTDSTAIVLNEPEMQTINAGNAVAGYFVGDLVAGRTGGAVGAAIGSQASKSCTFPIQINNNRQMYHTTDLLICTTVSMGDTVNIRRAFIQTIGVETREVKHEYEAPWRIVINQ